MEKADTKPPRKNGGVTVEKEKIMNTPIVMAAFGTTTRALSTYAYIDGRIRQRFPDHEIVWAYSSRMVKDWVKKRKNIDTVHPYEALRRLQAQKHEWAVVQSVHFLAGHEFYRLIEETGGEKIRTAIGLPLLSSVADYQRIGTMLAPLIASRLQDEAIVLAGHGTDHPIWASYLALQYLLRERFGERIFVGCVEEYPGADEIVARVVDAGLKKVCLIPFMLVAGVHFRDDLVGDDDDSWKSLFAAAGIQVDAVGEGIGMLPETSDILADHIVAALDVVLENIGVCEK